MVISCFSTFKNILNELQEKSAQSANFSAESNVRDFFFVKFNDFVYFL